MTKQHCPSCTCVLHAPKIVDENPALTELKALLEKTIIVRATEYTLTVRRVYFFNPVSYMELQVIITKYPTDDFIVDLETTFRSDSLSYETQKYMSSLFSFAESYYDHNPYLELHPKLSKLDTPDDVIALLSAFTEELARKYSMLTEFSQKNS